MSFVREFELHALGAETTDGADAESVDTLESSSGFAAPGGVDCRVLLAVTAINAFTSLDVKVEAETLSGSFVEIGTFPQIGAVTATSLIIPNCPRKIRTSWVVSGVSPSATFETTAVRMV